MSLCLCSAKEDQGHISSEKFRVVVDSAGRVSWLLSKLLHSTCPIDVTRFPFDSQKCVLRIGSQTYNGHEVDIQLLRNDGIELNENREHSEWKLKSITSKRRLQKYVCCPAPFVDIFFTFELERKPLYYAMTIIVPSIFLSLLASVSFLFPADSGERVSLVISVFLGLFVFMIIVNDRTPVTSDSVPMLTQFFTSIAASTVLCLIATAFILRLNHVTPGKDVPRYFERIRDWIAVPLLMRRNKRTKRIKFDFQNVLLNDGAAQYIYLGDIGQTPAGQPKLTEQQILQELQKISKHVEEENLASEVKQEWHYTMKVFDRLFFIIFFIMFLLFTTYVLAYF